MHLGSPLDALSNALYHAAWVTLPDRCYETRDWSAVANWTQAQREAAARDQSYPTKQVVCRPAPYDCEVQAMFAQTWGSTALGFGGVGGAAMTAAYTVVIRGPDGTMVVYWAGRFAYRIPADVKPDQRHAFLSDLAACQTVARCDAVARYGAQIEPEQTI